MVFICPLRSSDLRDGVVTEILTLGIYYLQVNLRRSDVNYTAMTLP